MGMATVGEMRVVTASDAAAPTYSVNHGDLAAHVALFSYTSGNPRKAISDISLPGTARRTDRKETVRALLENARRDRAVKIFAFESRILRLFLFLFLSLSFFRKWVVVLSPMPPFVVVVVVPSIWTSTFSLSSSSS